LGSRELYSLRHEPLDSGGKDVPRRVCISPVKQLDLSLDLLWDRRYALLEERTVTLSLAALVLLP
jgi:hypothetical protein